MSGTTNLSEPVGPYETFDACVTAMRAKDHSEESARAICGKMQKDSHKAESLSDTELTGDIVPLVEKFGADGTVPIRIIAPGWGSSGYYSRDVLMRDGPKAFPSGTHMFLDHPSLTEDRERPERSLKDLAAVTVAAPVYEDDGPVGPGLYAKAKVFSTHQKGLSELAPHIGVSIRALGKAEAGEADGRKGAIVREISQGRSVDFVTQPGAGGQIVSLFEALKRGLDTSTATLPGVGQTNEAEGAMDEAKLKEAQTALTEAQTKLAEAAKQNEALTADNARLTEAIALRDAKDIVVEEVGKAALPDVTKARITTSLAANPPVKDGKVDADALKARISEAVKDEAAYLAKVGAGAIRGMNGGPSGQAPDPKVTHAALKETFIAMGMDDATAEAAAKGRS